LIFGFEECLRSGRLFTSFLDRKGNQIPILFIRRGGQELPAVNLGERPSQKKQEAAPDFHRDPGFLTVNIDLPDLEFPDAKIAGSDIFHVDENADQVKGKIGRILEKAGDFIPDMIVPDVFIENGLVKGFDPGL
jgi:hypothetical protein